MTGSPIELTPLKRALLAIERLEGRVGELEGARSGPIAVVGLACRFPGGVDGPEAFLDFMRRGVDAVRPAPPIDRPTWPKGAAKDLPPAGYLDGDPGAFDPGFFGISPREAMSIDPQHRLFLECVWEALEHAGIDPRGLENTRTGVFAGITSDDYGRAQVCSVRAEELVDAHYASGVAHSMVSGRVSYILGLQGPSVSVNTACSSSLVAIHLACQSLRDEESDLVIAGGVNLILGLDNTRAFAQSQMLAADGRCKTFDEAADGFGRGEGCGVVVLRRLRDAELRGDRIHAVVRASAINQDGPSSGLTAPSGPAQEALMRETLARGGLRPTDVHYIEAHGTGTSLGDPIEVQALGAVYGEGRSADCPILIGSVKTNFGHLESAAGVAGFIKTVLCVREGEVPPHLHFRHPSTHIPWDRLPVKVVTEPTRPQTGDAPMRAAVSSFGFSGTNVHIVVEASSPGQREQASDELPGRLLVLSAASAEALHALGDAHRSALTDELNFADACYTAGVGRAHMAHRLALVASDAAEARALLEGWIEGKESRALRVGKLENPDRPRLAYMFTGQGAQGPAMGWSLYCLSPTYRDVLNECDELLREHLEVPLLQVLNPDGGHAELVHRTDYTQPALFAVQCGLAALLERWGIAPDVVLGHSVGEYAAAHLAGVFSLEDALKLIAARGRLMQSVTNEGRMAAIMTTEDRARAWVEDLGGTVSLAGINAPGQVVISGAADEVDEVVRRARASGFEVRPLRTSQAFHSPLMDGPLEELRSVLATVTLRRGDRMRFVSTLEGRLIDPGELADPEYWIRQARHTVRFTDAVEAAAALADRAVELGPHPALSGLVAQGQSRWPTHATLHRDRADWPQMLGALRDLYVEGVDVDWEGVEEGRPRQRIELPRYPFQRLPLWVELGAGRRIERPPAGAHPLLGQALAQPGPTRAFETTLSCDTPAFVADHVVMERPVLPGTAWLEMALAAGAEVLGSAVAVRTAEFLELLDLDRGPRRVHLSILPDGRGSAEVEIRSAPEPPSVDDRWLLHATARLVPAVSDPMPTVEWKSVAERCSGEVNHEAFYAQLASRGYQFGPRLRGVQQVRGGRGESLGRIALPEACSADEGSYMLHPLLTDAALQVAASGLDDSEDERIYVPFAVDGMRVAPGCSSIRSALAHARITARGSGTVTADVVLAEDDGRPFAMLEGVAFRELAQEFSLGGGPDFYEVRWTSPEGGHAADRPLPGEVAARAVEVMRASMGQEAEREDVPAYDEFIDALEARSAGYVLDAFRELGWDPAPGDVVRADALADALDVPPARKRLLARCLDILAEEGVLARRGAAWEVTVALAKATRSEDIPTLAGDSSSPEAILLGRCGPCLADGLRGVGDPLELLFPGGDQSLAETMYYDARMARVLNRSVAAAVAAAVEMTPPGKPFRILEVGGGTAGTTRRLVESLFARPGQAAARVELTFTDVSPLFLDRARRRFEGLAGFQYRTFDLDRDPATQGFSEGTYDVVVAANCIHAARDIRSALKGLRRLLRPGGLLLAPELFAPHRWCDLTVGLLDGWWHFTDVELRSDYACLSEETWRRVLAETGFVDEGVTPLASVSNARGYTSRTQGIVAAAAGRGMPAEPWLFISDVGALESEIVAKMRAEGATVCELGPAELDGAPPKPSAALSRALSEHRDWSGVVLCQPREEVDLGILDRAETDEAMSSLLDTLMRVVETIRGVAMSDGPRVPAIYLVTRGAQQVDDWDAYLHPGQACAWGLARAATAELPETRILCCDLDPVPGRTDAEQVVAWLAGAGTEPEVAFRRGEMSARRLVSRDARNIDGRLPQDYRLTPPTSASIEDLSFLSEARTAPRPGEIEIRVAASALNFKDVLNVLRMYPGDPGPFGTECAGVVSRVGEDVDVAVGTPVLAWVGDSYRQYVLANAALVAPIPKGLTFAEAASVPVAYATAHFALNHLGRLGPDDVVLIHSAAGGVGSAACTLARRAGARIIATAGTDAKREYLRKNGIADVFDSRSPSFVEGVLAATDGRGVDVLLNSLADELVDRSFDVMAHGGRFLEMGKRGIWTPKQVAALDRDVEYHLIDLGQTYVENRALFQRVFDEVMEALADGEIGPLPVECFRVEDAKDAFRHMATGRHVGKIVLQHRLMDDMPLPPFRSDGCYVITGGTSRSRGAHGRMGC